jgi:hypothetical protein
MLENTVLRRIAGPKRNVITGGWRKLHNEELYKLYASPNITRTKESRMRWVEHVAFTGRLHTRFLWESYKVTGHYKTKSERIILKWILEKWDGIVRTGFIWL